MTFSSPINARYFEDYVEGDVQNFGSAVVDADEQMAFSKRYDPQSIHTDPAAADKGPFGGIMASPGVDELRWLKPVRPGDVLSVRATIMKATPSKSKPDRGAVTTFTEVLNQNGEVVMSLTAVNIIGRRPAT